MRRTSDSYDDFIGKVINQFEEPKTYNTRTVTIQVTDRCNLACSYCYQLNKNVHVLPAATGKKFIDALLDGEYDKYAGYDKSTSIILEFIGGEPLLEIDLISELTDYFIEGLIKRNHPWQTRYMISICSNGTLYFDPRVQAYLNKHKKHISFSISIDGNKKLHDSCRIFPDGSGSYDLAIFAVHHYRKTYDPDIGSKMTIAPANVIFLSDAVISLIENGYDSIFLNCVYEEGWTEQHAAIFYQELKKLADYLLEHNLQDKIYLSIFEEAFFRPKAAEDNDNWCGSDASMLAIDWRGDLYPCIRYMESSLNGIQPPYKIGNVDTGIMANQEECNKVECLRCLTRRSQSTDECFDCPIAEGCSWCSGYNYQLYGTPNHRATFICIMHKARALANAYYWNKVYRLAEEPKRFKIWLSEEEALKIITEKEWKLLKWLESSDNLKG